MSITKTERRIVIAVGIGLGVAISSMLVRYALDVKADQVSRRPGNYDSLLSAEDNRTFPKVPTTLASVLPNAIVVHYEANQSRLFGAAAIEADYWVVETSGSFRSERLFVMVEESRQPSEQFSFFRASELYVTLNSDDTESEFVSNLPDGQYRMIGKNSRTRELIIQVKEFSPSQLSRTVNHFTSLPGVKEVRRIPWAQP